MEKGERLEAWEDEQRQRQRRTQLTAQGGTLRELPMEPWNQTSFFRASKISEGQSKKIWTSFAKYVTEKEPD